MNAKPMLFALLIGALSITAPAMAQTDPGPRPGPPSAGQPLPGLTPTEMAFFNEGLSRFLEVDSVSGAIPGATGIGLGPRFNSNSCASCHGQPTPGGSSPGLASKQNPLANPQIALATAQGAQNIVPSFITPDGPVRVVRFVNNPDGTPDGGVHDLFVVTGRSDAAGCNIQQPDFAAAVAQNNAIFRIPAPLFGAGLIEAIPDTAILDNKAANAQAKAQLGIAGHENRSANDGTITRFGWKAQNKSLTIFGGEAYNVEQGVTNELFPTERDETPGCNPNPLPEDYTNIAASTPLASISDVTGFVAFMRFLAPPQPAPPGNPSAARGLNTFNQIGCVLCHNASFTTGNALSPSLNNKPVQLYSDLLVHNMGSALADGISQGNATGNEFRTAPLWGLGQRLFFLHDGRTSDLVQAIALHSGNGSEANAVIAAWQALPAAAKQDAINFLRGL